MTVDVIDWVLKYFARTLYIKTSIEKQDVAKP